MNYSAPASVSNRPMRRSRIAAAVSAAAMVSAMSAPTFGQTLEEVLVTATKRSESVQDVPLAITALSGDFIREANLNDVKDLVLYTPGVSGNSQDSFIDSISVRGIRTQDFGVGGDPSAAFFKNDLYEGRNGSAVTSLYDLDRAEILRGPQGFLFGRNSIGGAFSIHTRRAEIGSNSGYISMDVAERGHFIAEGAVNIPVSDNFAMRLSGYSYNEDGFADNKYNGDDLVERDNWALRWSTAFERDNLSIYTTVEYEERDQSGSVYRAVDKGDIWETLEAAIGPIDLLGGNEDVDSDQFGGDNDDPEITSFGMRIDYDFDFATLTSNTGFKDHDYFYNEDYDGTSRNISNYRQDQDGDYFQQELRLTSNGDDPLAWYAGVSYYKENIDTKFTFIAAEDVMCQYYGYYYNYGMTFSGCADLYAYYGSPWTPSADGTLTETGRIKGEYEGWGVYVNLDYQVTDTINVGVGVRYTDDEKDFRISVPTPDSELGPYWAYGFSTDGFIHDNKSWDKVTPRAIVRWQPTDDRMLFASYTKGFKSGGFGSFNLGNNADGDPAVGNVDLTQADGYPPNAFDPEDVDSFELGYKDTLFNGLANVDLVAFYYEYSDLQVVTFDGGASIVQNVGNVDAYGLEGSITAAMGEYFTLYMAMGWLDSEAKDLQQICGLEDPNGCEDSELFWAPDYTGSMVLNADYPVSGGSITGSLEAFWEGDRGGGWESLNTTEIDSAGEITLRVGYRSDSNWNVEAYVENLTDEFSWDGQNNNGGVLPSHFFGPRRPRTFGMRAGFDWD